MIIFQPLWPFIQGLLTLDKTAKYTVFYVFSCLWALMGFDEANKSIFPDVVKVQVRFIRAKSSDSAREIIHACNLFFAELSRVVPQQNVHFPSEKWGFFRV